MVELAELKSISYPEQVFEGKSSVLQPDEAQPNEKNGVVRAKFCDYETLVRYDWRNGEVWAKCTCQKYADLEPCEHIVSVFVNYAKSLKPQKKEEPTAKKDEIDEFLEERAKKEQKAKAIRKFAPQQAEQALIIKADDLDEQLAIKEFVEGTEPLVYRIKTSRGERLILSIRGWTQAMLYQGNIEIVDVKFEEVGGKSIAKAIVRDTARNIVQIGIAERYTNNEFKWTTLASKAIRNALKKVISPKYEQLVIQEALNANLVIDLSLKDLREVAEP
jgi:hypothetical protein